MKSSRFKVFAVFALALIGLLTITAFMSRNVKAASLGDYLDVVESGWTRFNDTNSLMTYNSTPDYYPGVSTTCHEGDISRFFGTNSVSFSFTGTGVRILALVHGYPAQIAVNLDGTITNGIDTNYNPEHDPYNGQGRTLVYQSTSLSNTQHTVTITIYNDPNPPGYGGFCFDAVDIQSGSLGTPGPIPTSTPAPTPTPAPTSMIHTFTNSIALVGPYDPPSINYGHQIIHTENISVASMNDLVQVGFSNDLNGITMTGYVSANDVVKIIFFNGNDFPVDLPAGMIRIKLTKLTPDS